MASPKAEAKKKQVPFFASLQVKYAMSYLAIFAVVLVLLNTYPVIASQDLLFTSKRDSLKSQTAVMASALTADGFCDQAAALCRAVRLHGLDHHSRGPIHRRRRAGDADGRLAGLSSLQNIVDEWPCVRDGYS